MKIEIIFALILITIKGVFLDDDKYCGIRNCPDFAHTLCKYPKYKLGEKCPTPPVSDLLSKDEIESIVNYHNFFRDLNIETLEISKPHTSNSASRPYLLKWDKELSYIAQRWADQCETVVDECRNVERFNVTQRVDVRKTSADKLQPTLLTSIKWWYDQDCLEAKYFGNFSLEEGTLNDCNQMPWGNANRIGCGILRTLDNKHTLYFVCNYGYMNNAKQSRSNS